MASKQLVPLYPQKMQQHQALSRASGQQQQQQAGSPVSTSKYQQQQPWDAYDRAENQRQQQQQQWDGELPDRHHNRVSQQKRRHISQQR